MSFNPYIKIIEMAFDATKVREAAQKAREIAMRAGGALVRRLALRLLQRQRGTAKPGQPPLSHEGDLKTLMFFAFDSGSNTEVIGPALKPGSSGETIPNLLEFGGERKQTFKSGNSRQIRYHAFPFMAPALKQASSQLPSHWANSVRSS